MSENENENSFACPRRAESFRPMIREDNWRSGHGMIGQARGCSYCGSMNPDDFMEAVRNGMEVGPTDKNYKVYLSEPITDEQKAEARQKRVEFFTRLGLDEEKAKDAVKREGDLFSHGKQIGKFYFQHLSKEQQIEFIQLLNEKKVNFGYPGRFYVLPFFVSY